MAGEVRAPAQRSWEAARAIKDLITGSVQQVGTAVNQMDQAKQQNATLVGESAAAADSLRGHAQHLVHAVAVFRPGCAASRWVPLPSTAPPKGPPPTPQGGAAFTSVTRQTCSSARPRSPGT